MAVLPIYTYGTSVLRKKAKPVQKIDDAIIKLVMDMFETMRKANGIGLAANQVGNLNRVIVIDLSDVEDYKDTKPLVLINPAVVELEGKWLMEEGCLSIPDVRDEVERAERVRLRFKDTNFEEMELEAAGLIGRVILHEIDHIDGILFLDHVAPKKRKLHNDELKKIQRGEIEVAYPVVTAATVEV